MLLGNENALVDEEKASTKQFSTNPSENDFVIKTRFPFHKSCLSMARSLYSLIGMPLFKTAPKFGWYCPDWMQSSRWLQFGAGSNQIVTSPARITNTNCISLNMSTVFL